MPPQQHSNKLRVCAWLSDRWLAAAAATGSQPPQTDAAAAAAAQPPMAADRGKELPPAAQAPSASSIARAFNKRLLKVQLLHELHHEEPMELGEATRMTRASSGGASDACMHHHVLRRVQKSSPNLASFSFREEIRKPVFTAPHKPLL